MFFFGPPLVLRYQILTSFYKYCPKVYTQGSRKIWDIIETYVSNDRKGIFYSQTKGVSVHQTLQIMSAFRSILYKCAFSLQYPIRILRDQVSAIFLKFSGISCWQLFIILLLNNLY